MESFYISTADPEVLPHGFEKQGFSVEKLEGEHLRVTGNDWEDVIVEVRVPNPGTPSAAVNGVGTNALPPPFGFWRFGMGAMLGRRSVLDANATLS